MLFLENARERLIGKLRLYRDVNHDLGLLCDELKKTLLEVDSDRDLLRKAHSKLEASLAKTSKKLAETDSLLAEERVNSEALQSQLSGKTQELASEIASNISLRSEVKTLKSDLEKASDRSEILQDQVEFLAKVNVLNHRAVEAAIASTVGYEQHGNRATPPEVSSDGD